MKNWQLYILVSNIYGVGAFITENVFMAGLCLAVSVVWGIIGFVCEIIETKNEPKKETKLVKGNIYK